MVFSWAVVALQTVAEWRLKLPFLGAITLPIAALALILMQVLPGEIRPLVPALQSTWLQIHVTLAMLSYAGLHHFVCGRAALSDQGRRNARAIS